MSPKEKMFIEELRDLFKKHNVRFDSYDQYDGQERYCGKEYSIVGDGIDIDIDDLLNI